MSTRLQDHQLAQSRKQTLLAVLMAAIIGLLWFNSSHFNKPRSPNRSRAARAQQASPLQTLPESVALPRCATVLREDVLLRDPQAHGFAVSPDTNAIAYVDRDTLFCQYLPDGPAIKLDELPFAQSVALQWSTASDRVFYAGFARNAPEILDVYEASPRQRGAKLTSIDSEFSRHWQKKGHQLYVTSDAEYVVRLGLHPLIWDVEHAGLVVCSFDLLLPSKTSSRWLAVEIDTAQLVILQRDFKIVRRIDCFLESPSGSQLEWSPDEKYACIFPARHAGRRPAQRVDLQTGDIQPLSLDHYDPALRFTGESGELFLTGERITTIPMSGVQPRFNVAVGRWTRCIPSGPRVCFVAIEDGIVKEGELRPSRYQWRIANATGRVCLLEQPGTNLARGTVLGFGDHGQTLIVYLDRKLLGIPVASIFAELTGTDEE